MHDLFFNHIFHNILTMCVNVFVSMQVFVSIKLNKNVWGPEEVQRVQDA